MNQTILAAAHNAVRRGWRPFPLDHPDLPSCIGLHRPEKPCKGDRGKHPAVAYGAACAIEPPDGLLATWFNGSPRNVGIACGPSGLLVIDEDELDALRHFAHSLGETVPATYRVRTRRGWHHYFLAPTDIELGNSAGALAAHGMDVRGGKGLGGYVVGAGSVHESGHVYAAEDPEVIPAELPRWLIEQILGSQGAAGSRSLGAQTPPHSQCTDLRPARAVGGFADDWDDEPRYGTASEFLAQYQRRLGECRTPGGEFRHELFRLARDGWRLVDLGLLTEDALYDDCEAVIRRVWGAGHDAEDSDHVEDGRVKAAASPWVVVVAESEPAREGSGGGRFDPTSTAYQAAFAAEKRKERIRRAVRAELAAEDAVPLVTLSGAAFLSAPTPKPLVKGLLYEDGLHQIFGAEGSGKSLFALDIALSLAAGKRCGLVEPTNILNDAGRDPVAVHYVMAEGQAVNVERTLAWLRHRGLPDSAIDLFTAIPMGISLTRSGVEPYLDVLARDKPALVVLDTKIAMMEGNENYSSDNAEMVKAMHLIRTAAGGACVWLVDHTGLHDRSRSRGNQTIKGSVETQHRCEVDEETGLRTVWLDRDKGGEPGAHWAFRLKEVESAVVCVPVTEDERRRPWSAGEGGWWRHDATVVPDEVARLEGKGRSAARDVFRVLAFVAEHDGLTSAQIWSALSEGPLDHSRSAYFAGMAQLKEEGIAVVGSTPAKIALAPRYDVSPPSPPNS